MFFYTANQLDIRASLSTQENTAAAGRVEGTPVDISDLEGPLLAYVNSPVASSGDTVTYTVEDSETTSDADFDPVAAGDLVDPDTGDPATFTVVTDAVAVAEFLALKRENLRRYVRIVATTVGSGIDVYLLGLIVGQKKYTG